MCMSGTRTSVEATVATSLVSRVASIASGPTASTKPRVSSSSVRHASGGAGWAVMRPSSVDNSAARSSAGQPRVSAEPPPRRELSGRPTTARWPRMVAVQRAVGEQRCRGHPDGREGWDRAEHARFVAQPMSVRGVANQLQDDVGGQSPAESGGDRSSACGTCPGRSR